MKRIVDEKGDIMQLQFEIILIVTIFLSMVPVVNMFRNRNDQKYACLKVLIYATFFWTILIVVERISTNTAMIYYAGILGYPLRLLFATLMLCTIFQYVEKKFPKQLLYVLAVLLLIDITIALTNSRTLWFLELKQTDLTTFNDLYIANKGILFTYHLILSYMVAIAAIALLFYYLSKQKGIRQYKEVTRMMAIGVFVVLIFNMLQLFVLNININLTYISMVFVAYILYDVIYRKDMVFNLRTSGRGEILSNMREMYVLTDNDSRIIEISPLLVQKYQLDLTKIMSKPFSELVDQIKDQVKLYSEHYIEDEGNETKDHYHLREKSFKLNGMNETGHMILLYDETQVFYLLRELNRLSNYDAMTGLNNRNYIEHKLESYKNTKGLGVLSLDLNGLKINNDYLGHERGDYLLKTLASKIKNVFNDLNYKEIARIGGDEFLIITHQVTPSVLEDKVKALLESCEHPEIDKVVSVSVGYAYDEQGIKNIYQLIQEADQKMYAMKEKVSKIYQQNMIEFIKLQDKYIR
jgi:diguanylate cyclase (GGDEF)-like protein